MIEYILEFLGIYIVCLFKFIGGPVLGTAANYTILEIMIVTVSGMMTSVFLFTFLGEWIKHKWKIHINPNPKTFTPKTRRIITIWQKFGAPGVAALTPLILTPIGGTIILTSFGVKRRKIFLYMLISAVIWSLFLGASINKILEIPFFSNMIN
ncbi:hypothetical protein QWY93_04380 [Echinicola jeungdonensis]|nr:hypothetical protein [Echinicola jeungdonensis]MDN3668559.1 hypothetical protein [Echinicola jeungdonensis]